MAVVNQKSTIIANRDAVPKVLTDSYVSGGSINESQGYATATNGDSIGSTYRLCQVPSNARVSSVVLQNAALGSGATVNVGVYYPTFIPQGGGNFLASSVAGTAINATLYASAQAVATANGPTEIVNQSGNNSISNQELTIWQSAGLTSDPGIFLDIVVTVSAAIATTGLIGLKVKYGE